MLFVISRPFVSKGYGMSARFNDTPFLSILVEEETLIVGVDFQMPLIVKINHQLLFIDYVSKASYSVITQLRLDGQDI